MHAQGLAPSRAWQTLAKALRRGKDAHPAGTHLLFKRGTRYAKLGEGGWVEGEASTEAAPFVIGSYGEAALADPVLDVSLVVYGKHVTIRDLELHRVSLQGSHFLLYHLTVHAMGSEPEHRGSNNLIYIGSGASYCAVVECLLCTCSRNAPAPRGHASSRPHLLKRHRGHLCVLLPRLFVRLPSQAESFSRAMLCACACACACARARALSLSR